MVLTQRKQDRSQDRFLPSVSLVVAQDADVAFDPKFGFAVLHWNGDGRDHLPFCLLICNLSVLSEVDKHRAKVVRSFEQISLVVLCIQAVSVNFVHRGILPF